MAPAVICQSSSVHFRRVPSEELEKVFGVLLKNNKSDVAFSIHITVISRFSGIDVYERTVQDSFECLVALLVHQPCRRGLLDHSLKTQLHLGG
jgi:hypothetical protein